MVILFDTLSILLPTAILENCLETLGQKLFSTSCAKLRCPLFVQLESFLIVKPWSSSQSRRLSSLFDLYLLLFYLWNCSTCIYLWLSQKLQTLWTIFLSSGWMSPPFPCVDCHTCPPISQWNCPTWLCVTFTQCSFINYKPSYCFLSFHTLPLYCMDCHTFLPLFWVELSHSSLCECHTNVLCVLSLITVWMSHLRVSIFFVWMSHEYPCVSITFKWTLHFVSF